MERKSPFWPISTYQTFLWNVKAGFGRCCHRIIKKRGTVAIPLSEVSKHRCTPLSEVSKLRTPMRVVCDYITHIVCNYRAYQYLYPLSEVSKLRTPMRVVCDYTTHIVCNCRAYQYLYHNLKANKLWNAKAT